ncbi:hypothetical protein BGX26_007817, partial [Mortierella sp. AD094]
TNVHTYKTHSLSHRKQKFDTWKGRKITKEITRARKALGVSTILPFSIIDKTRPNPTVVFINSGCQRFDVFKGAFTVDDTYIVSPFHDDFEFATVPYKVAKNLLNGLNKAPFQKRAEVHTEKHAPPANVTLTPGYVTKDDYGLGGDDWPHSPIPYVATPNYVSTDLPTGLGDNDLVDVAWLSFFTNLMAPLFKKLDPAGNYTIQPYRVGITTYEMWPIYAKAKWANATC